MRWALVTARVSLAVALCACGGAVVTETAADAGVDNVGSAPGSPGDVYCYQPSGSSNVACMCTTEPIAQAKPLTTCDGSLGICCQIHANCNCYADGITDCLGEHVASCSAGKHVVTSGP